MAAHAEDAGIASCGAPVSKPTSNVYEGQSHAQYQFDDRVPETKEAFGEIAAFFGNHLGQ